MHNMFYSKIINGFLHQTFSSSPYLYVNQQKINLKLNILFLEKGTNVSCKKSGCLRITMEKVLVRYIWYIFKYTKLVVIFTLLCGSFAQYKIFFHIILIFAIFRQLYKNENSNKFHHSLTNAKRRKIHLNN